MPDPLLVARLRAAGCVFAEDEAELLEDAASDPVQREVLVRRREAGEPLEYVVGWAAFDGLRVAVAPGVFIPRQRTAYLVELAAAHLAGTSGPLALDLCCGSGALGLALARRSPGLRLHAVDIDPVAVACAQVNLAGVGGQAVVGDLTSPLPRGLTGSVDVVLANVPYVPTRAVDLMPADSREHEPRFTVDGGADGLDLLRRVAIEARDWLRPDGLLLAEVADDQLDAATAAFAAAGLAPTTHHDPERETTALAGRR
ncbi:putative protein N(5)-glutamine methyltransferase [Nocardioides caeni]|uniref:peptide chain release factor N(5)-glutamine methyltransferase n=1 Tax=Nocardioides caeni TaxID=574700 RepID=A0A4S8N556_9ACTN|nr:putative protein N(5)-glutamine methyltransferase [Nocardioides caeni]THV11253.1 putative protein N(5)-glutamine methyltransferase [Nocardioides caeni]